MKPESSLPDADMGTEHRVRDLMRFPCFDVGATALRAVLPALPLRNLLRRLLSLHRALLSPWCGRRESAAGHSSGTITSECTNLTANAAAAIVILNPDVDWPDGVPPWECIGRCPICRCGNPAAASGVSS